MPALHAQRTNTPNPSRNNTEEQTLPCASPGRRGGGGGANAYIHTIRDRIVYHIHHHYYSPLLKKVENTGRRINQIDLSQPSSYRPIHIHSKPQHEPRNRQELTSLLLESASLNIILLVVGSKNRAVPSLHPYPPSTASHSKLVGRDFCQAPTGRN